MKVYSKGSTAAGALPSKVDPKYGRGRWESGYAVAALLIASSAFYVLVKPSAAAHGEDSDALLQLSWFGAAALAGVVVFARSLTPGRRVGRIALAVPMLAFISTIWSQSPFMTARRSVSLAGGFVIATYLAQRFSFVEIVRIVYRAALVGSLASVAAALRFRAAFDEYGKLRGVFFHKNLLGQIAALGLLSCVLLIGAAESGRRRRLVISAGFFLGVLLASGSKTSLVAVSVVLASVAIVSGIGRPGTRCLTIGATAIGAAMAVVTASMLTVGSALAFLGRDSTLTGRTALWDGIFRAIHERPVTGRGYGAFWTDRVGPAVHLIGLVPGGAHSAHNGYLEILLALGFVGLVVVVGVLALTFRSSMIQIARGEFGEGFARIGILLFALAYNFGEADLFQSKSLLSVLLIVVILKDGPAPRAMGPLG